MHNPEKISTMIPKRVVIDTNVCLDLFVFRDPRWQPLLAALECGSLQAVTRSDCRMEWLIVLDYPHLPLDGQSRATAAADFDTLILCLNLPPLEQSEGGFRLPLCRDQDDQKFLELALAAQADLLITKDKALLKLSGKLRRAGLFSIVTPEAWLASTLAPAAEATTAAVR
jgi:putative PIN family toxin of toxin-antitoxin system